MYNRAETCVVVTKTDLLIHDYKRTVQFRGYDEGVSKTEACRTVNAVIVYDYLESGYTYMLVLHQAILITQMEKNLLCPLQMTYNDVRVNYGDKVPDNSVPDRYYTGEEYQALNDAQKKGLNIKRAKRGHNSKVKHGRPSGGGGGNKIKMELSKRSIKDLV